MTSRVLVTGASGFVGRILCETLAARGMRVRATVHETSPEVERAIETCQVGAIGRHTDWGHALEGVDWVMHLAALAHVSGPRFAWDRAAYQEVNAAGTARLVGAAARSGVARFIYLSSAKVNGEFTSTKAYSPHDEPNPADAYARSKWEGELAVHNPSLGSAMQCATVRAPLVYGSGVRANFLRLMQLIDRGVVLPFGAVRNRRSLISVWNLVDALIRVTEHPAAPGRVWMVSDGADVSTPQLISALARAMGKPARLVNVPVGLLYVAGALTARRSQLNRLCRSLVVDISETRSQLGWMPPLTLMEGLARTVAWYQGRSDGETV